MKTNPRPSRGFTLVELLVVIVIVAALAAITFASVVKIRAKAADTVCLSKIRQLGQAAMGASIESRGYLAATFFDAENAGSGKVYWWEKIAPHVYTEYDRTTFNKLDGLFRDPTSPGCKGIPDSEFRSPRWPEISWMPWQNSQDVSAALNSSRPGIHLNSLRRAAGQPFLTSANNTGSSAVWNKSQFNRWVVPAATRHDGKIFIFYCDGHAETPKITGSAADYKRIAPSMPDA